MIATALSLVALVIATGCSTSPTTTSAPVPAAALAPDATARAVQPIGPFNGLLTESAAQEDRLETATNVLTAECMRQRSFDYVAPKLPAPVDAEATTNDYELIAPQTASAQGYGIVDNALTNKADENIGSSQQPQGNRPGFTAALTGTDQHKVTLTIIGGSTVFFDSDGCVTEAVVELYGQQWNQVSFNLQALVSGIEHTVLTSSAWTGAISKWSACLSSRFNVHFPEPDAARTAVGNSVSTAVTGVSTATAETRLHAMRPGEVTLAQQDATCQQAVGLAAVVQQAQAKAQSNDAQQYATLMSTYSSELAHANQMADQILGHE